MRRSMIAAVVAALLVTAPSARAGLFGIFESTRERAARAHVEELVQLCESGADGQTLINACFWLWKNSHLLKEEERQKLVAPLLSVLDDTAEYDDITHREVIPLLSRLRRPEVIPALLACLEHKDRPLTRFQAGIALILLGQARAGLPAVEERARRGQTVDTVGRALLGASPTDPFIFPLLTLPDKGEDSALNEYFVRVLSYPSQWRRIDAIQFLLLKHGANKEAAFAAATDILEQPLSPEGNTHYLLKVLREHGGTRGKVLVEACEKR